MPFRFGVVTLTESRQAFVRVRIALEDGREAWGAAAEMLAPKWFDKNPALSNEENFAQLRRSLKIAGALYTEGRVPRSAFRLFAENYRRQIDEAQQAGLNSLIAGYGPALLDRAVL